VRLVTTRSRGSGARGDQDPAGVWTTPGGDQIAWFRDPDGNVLSLTQFHGSGPAGRRLCPSGASIL